MRIMIRNRYPHVNLLTRTWPLSALSRQRPPPIPPPPEGGSPTEILMGCRSHFDFRLVEVFLTLALVWPTTGRERKPEPLDVLGSQKGVKTESNTGFEEGSDPHWGGGPYQKAPSSVNSTRKVPRRPLAACSMTAARGQGREGRQSVRTAARSAARRGCGRNPAPGRWFGGPR